MKKIYNLVLATVVTGAMSFTFFQNGSPTRQYIPREALPKQMSSWDGAVEIQKYLHGDNYTALTVYEELEKAERLASRKSGSLGINWSSMGPDNIGGRTRVILQSPTDPNKIWLGSASGGLFVTDNGGNTWRPVNDLAPNNIIGSGAIASNGDIYIGTGCSFDGFASSLFIPWPGKGIYKSTDGGNTFNLLPSTVPSNAQNVVDSNSNTVKWAAVNDIAIDPRNPNHIYAATNQGLQRSLDGGLTWDNPLFLICGQLQAGDHCYDAKFTSDNSRLVVSSRQGLFYSDDPANEACYTRVEAQPGGVLPTGLRVELASAASNPNVMYALTSVQGTAGFGAVFGNVYRSNDKGETWAVVDPAPPINSPNWEICGGNGQCVYNLAIGVYPDNEDHFLIGGVQIWRYDGNWTRVANENIDPFSPDGMFYVHADKHNFTWDRNDPSKVMISTDGGLHITEDRATTFNTKNKDYITTQFYGMAVSKNGVAVGGTQDNGVLLLNSEILGTGRNSNRVRNQDILNGDGFDCQVSNIVDLKFTTAQFANLGRGQIESFVGSGICGGLCGNGPFWTVIRLWESDNDLSSKDSIDFKADTINQAIAVGNAAIRTFTGTLDPPQASAKIVSSSLTFSAGNQVVSDADGDGQFSTADGTATVNFTTGTFSVTFNNPPNLNLAVFANYGVEYDAGAEVEVLSATDNIPVKHILAQDLNAGQSIKIQDPIQSLMAFSAGGGVQIARGVINRNRAVEWINVSQGLQASETPSGTGVAYEFTKDGNHLFVATGNGLFRISNLNELYTATDRIKLTSRRIFNAPAGEITGLAIHPTDEEKVVVTVGGYGVAEHVFLLENAISATGNAQRRVVQGIGGAAPLPQLPVYDAEFDEFNPSTVLVGTLYGVWATNDIFADPVQWTNTSATLARVPAYDIVQQKLTADKASNSGMMYVATHGRGIWSTDAFVSVPEYNDIKFGSDFKPTLKVYPNPMQTAGSIAFELPASAQGQVSIFAINGAQIWQSNRGFVQGENIVNFDASTLSKGTYIAVLEVNGTRSVAKFVKR